MMPRTGLIVALLLLGAGTLRAQTVATINAVANVTTIGLSAGFTQELDFGTVVAGVLTTVDPGAAPNAGIFEIHGTPRAEIQITMTLPTQLTLGASSMPITFGPNGACHWNRNRQDQCRYFDPSAPLVDRIRNRTPPNNTFYVWIGGTVAPAAAQPGGTYAGDITLTAAYTGN